MPASTSAPSSLKEYLKRYESTNEEEKKTKKKKKKTKPQAIGVLVVDEDPAWQKPVSLEEEDDNSADEETPQIDEDIEVKRMRRLEQLRAQRAYNAIAEDGSGWVSLSPKHARSNSPSKQRTRNDTPSPEPEINLSGSGKGEDDDLSPPRQQWRRHQSPFPDHDIEAACPLSPNSDISPPRRQRTRNASPSPGVEIKSLRSGGDGDLSPPRLQQRYHHAQSLEPKRQHMISRRQDADASPPRKRRFQNGTPSPEEREFSHASFVSDLSPPRKSRKDSGRCQSAEISPQHSFMHSAKNDISHEDLSPPRRRPEYPSSQTSLKERPKTGLITGSEIREEITKTKKDEWLRLQEMDPSISGRGAEPVFRDKMKGQRISKEEFFKSQQKKVEEKPKEQKIEWGKGLAQKREAEARLKELEQEKDKPFARTRDDPDLDKMLKDRLRWGDPMAHLVKKRHSEPVLQNLGDDEKMKESGFVIPQEIPSHSWIRRRLDAAPNRYGIRPGRHWDGVDRSNGFEKELFKKMNEKQATEREAYLWSVSDM